MNTSRVKAKRTAQRDAQRRATVTANTLGKILASRMKLNLDWSEFTRLLEAATGKTKLGHLEQNELHAVNMVLAHRLEEAFPSPGVSDAQAAEILGL